MRDRGRRRLARVVPPVERGDEHSASQSVHATSSARPAGSLQDRPAPRMRGARARRARSPGGARSRDGRAGSMEPVNAPPLAAVLWDMDGTLVDTEPYWMAAETPLVESFGGTWSHEQALGLVGLGLEDSARIFQDAGVRMGVRDIVDHLTDDVMGQLATTGVPVPPGRARAARRACARRASRPRS